MEFLYPGMVNMSYRLLLIIYQFLLIQGKIILFLSITERIVRTGSIT